MKNKLSSIWKGSRLVIGVMSLYICGSIIYLQRVGDTYDSYQKRIIEPARLASDAGPTERFNFGPVVYGNEAQAEEVTNPYTGKLVLLATNGDSTAERLMNTRARLMVDEVPRLFKIYQDAVAKAPLKREEAETQVVNYGYSVFALCIAFVSFASLVPPRSSKNDVATGDHSDSSIPHSSSELFDPPPVE